MPATPAIRVLDTVAAMADWEHGPPNDGAVFYWDSGENKYKPSPLTYDGVGLTLASGYFKFADPTAQVHFGTVDQGEYILFRPGNSDIRFYRKGALVGILGDGVTWISPNAAGGYFNIQDTNFKFLRNTFTTQDRLDIFVKTSVSGTDYEQARLTMDSLNGRVELAAESAGTGAADLDIHLIPLGAGQVQIQEIFSLLATAVTDTALTDDTTRKKITLQKLASAPTNAAYIAFSNNPGTDTFYLVLEEG